MKLSADFSLDEFTVSQTAARQGIDNTPSAAEIENLKRLCETVLQPLRDALGCRVVVSSGYRSSLLNAMVGGSARSAHKDGRAADIIIPGMTSMEVAREIRVLALPFEQVINEFGRWCHVSIPPDGKMPIRQLLTATRGAKGVAYLDGLQPVTA